MPVMVARPTLVMAQLAAPVQSPMVVRRSRTRLR